MVRMYKISEAARPFSIRERPVATLPHWATIVRANPTKYEREILKQTTGSIRAPSDVARLLAERVGRLTHEEFYVLCLDKQCTIIGMTMIASGDADTVNVRVSQILRLPVIYGACAMVLVHNHPSGNATPSPDDVTLTDKVFDLADRLGITLLDHVVCGISEVRSMHQDKLGPWRTE